MKEIKREGKASNYYIQKPKLRDTRKFSLHRI